MKKILAVGLMFLAANAIAKHDGSNYGGCGCGSSKPPATAPAPSPAPTPAPAPSPAPAPTPAPAKGSITPAAPTTVHRSYGPTTGHPLTWDIAPIEHKLAEPPQIVYVPVERIVEKVIEVPVYTTVNVCPAEEPKPAVIQKRKIRSCK